MTDQIADQYAEMQINRDGWLFGRDKAKLRNDSAEDDSGSGGDEESE